jgi:hypothetical protein
MTEILGFPPQTWYASSNAREEMLCGLGKPLSEKVVDPILYGASKYFAAPVAAQAADTLHWAGFGPSW